MQEDKREVLPQLPAGSDLLSLQLYNEHRIDPAVRNLLTTNLTSQLDPSKKVTALILGARCGLVAQILLPFCSHIDLVEEEQFAKVLQWRFVEGKEVDYFFGKEGFIGCRHAYPAPQLNGTSVRIITAEALKTEGKSNYDLIVVQNPIITAQTNLIEQLLATEHSLMITMMVPGNIQISDPKLFRFFARFQRQVIPQYYNVLSYQSIQNRRHVTIRRGQIIYYEVYSFQRKEGPPPTQQQLLELLADDQPQAEGQEALTNVYEGKTMVDTYLLFHYGPSYFGIENFPKACADVCLQEAKKRGIQGRALDLGCAVGRSTVDLAQYFNEVVGLDYSNAFIQAAQKVLEEQYVALTPKVKYVVGDACNLDKSLGKFNLIFGGNLIDRLPDPAAFLQSVSGFLQPKGLLILTSPYSWLAQFTPPAKWIGGIIENGVPVSTPEGLKRELQKSGLKNCREEDNLRFVIKDNDWVYQYTLANVTFWLKEE